MFYKIIYNNGSEEYFRATVADAEKVEEGLRLNRLQRMIRDFQKIDFHYKTPEEIRKDIS